MTKLAADDVEARVKGLAGWAVEGDAIVKEFRFGGFPEAIAFVVRVGMAAEVANHHPDLDIRYNRVRVALSTHSEGGLTEKDFALAAEADVGQQN